MRGDLLDLILVILVAAFAVSGYRQGFIVGILSFVGFLGGGVLGALVAPSIAREVIDGAAPQALLAIVIVFLAATLGQFVASSVGVALRSRVTWRSAGLPDAIGGAVISVFAVLLITGLLGASLENSPFPLLNRQVQNSVVLAKIDELMPAPAKRWFESFRQTVSGPFPEVFGGIGAEPFVEVAPPDRRVLTTPGLRRAERAVVKILGTAPDCARRLEGTGFVYAPERVMTNAHVLAGVRGGAAVHLPGGQVLRGRVVLYNPRRDIAVLHVPGLDLRPLEFGRIARTGDDAVVAGYPHNRSFTAVAARIRGRQEARGPDIYHATQVRREIYSIRSRVEPGNSGGPLLAPDGSVYGVVFAAAVGNADTGYALTAEEVAPDAESGRFATRAVSTQSCD